MVRQAHQAVPVFISQLAELGPPMSFHSGQAGLDRGHAEFKGYIPHTALILPMGVYFHHTDQCFDPEGSWKHCSSIMIETLIEVKTNSRQGH